MYKEITDPVNAKVWSCVSTVRLLDRTVKGKALVSTTDRCDIITLPDKVERVLQQQWVSSDGEIEWRDVPVVEEEK